MSPKRFFQQYGFNSAVLSIVVLAHLVLLAFLFIQELQPTPEADSEGAVRVQLAMQLPSTPEVPEPPPLTPQPPVPKAAPTQPLLASHEPKERAVKVPPLEQEPAKVPNAPPVATPAQATPAQSAPPSTKDPAAKPNETPDNRPVAKQMSQLSCRVPKPQYPRAAQRLNQSGDVQVRLVINEQGHISGAEVVGAGSGFVALDQAALAAARAAVCQPFADEAGRYRIVITAQTFNFSPDN